MAKTRKELLTNLAMEVADLRGCVVEIGVFSGASAELLRELFSGETLHLFDTFAGLPVEMFDASKDENTPLKFAATLDDVARKIARPVEFHVGLFPGTAVDVYPCRYLHIDVDYYQSTLAALQWGWKQLVDGGVIVVDDYGFSSCRGCKMAVDEWWQREQPTIEFVLQRAVIRK